MSNCVSAISAIDSAVTAPMTSTTDLAVSLNSYKGLIRATMKMPAVTMVAAWISAEIGVGPSIESGSHTWSGTCALLPMAPMNRQMQMTERSDHWSAPQRLIVVPVRLAACAKTGA